MTTTKRYNKNREKIFSSLYKLYEKYFTWSDIFESEFDTLFIKLMAVATDEDKKLAMNSYQLYYVEIGKKMGYVDAMDDIKFYTMNKKEEGLKC